MKLIFLFGLLAFFQLALTETLTEENEGKAVLCGGTIEADSDSLIYPRPGQSITPGEICVWTINLVTKKQFHLNFTNLGINGGDDLCSKGGVRLYAISNLLPADKPEDYTFCNETKPDSTFYLGESVAVVVLYTSAQSTYEGNQFTLSWEGVETDQLRTRHLANFLTTSTAIIRYPYIGQYEQNLAATWLIHPDFANETNPQMNLDLNYLRLESCDFPEDPCACDAFILYEITYPLGLLNEVKRFCENSTVTSFGSLHNIFILGFFSDFKSQSDIQGGFEAVYYPNSVIITESPGTTSQTQTTTRSPPSTTQSPIDISQTCGETLQSNEGMIQYKLGTYYDNNERCVWTVVLPKSSSITFNLNYGNIELGYDYIQISTFSTTKNESYFHRTARFESTGSITMPGSIAIITFASDNTDIFQGGFELAYKGNEVEVPGYKYSSQLFTEKSGKIDYPYSTNLLAAHIFPSPNFINVGTSNLLKIELDSSYLDCESTFRFYLFTRSQGFQLSEQRFPCWTEAVTTIEHTDMVLAILFSDDSLGLPFDEQIELTYNWTT